jgi:hypothetical protein
VIDPPSNWNLFRASLLSFCLLFSACVHSVAPPATTGTNDTADLTYDDLRAGWRVRVTIPILSSGGYVPTTPQGDPRSDSVGKDFIGYETDYYFARPQKDLGIRLTFSGADVVENGITSKRNRPRLDILDLPPTVRFARLVYLIRESAADHDTELLAAADKNTLDRLTTAVASNDFRMCESSLKVACIKVPVGVAVVPEHKADVDGHMQWRPIHYSTSASLVTEEGTCASIEIPCQLVLQPISLLALLSA